MATSRMAEQVGRVLGGRYRLVAPLGTGASAQVFLADDVTLRRRVAVKVLHPALAEDDSFLRRFRAEARAAAALSHPNVMAVFDWGEDDGPYLVLEFLGGGSLRAMLDRGHRLSPAQALVVGLEAARALDVAHRRGFVHRDVKPANLLFGEDERLRIADFGLARALSEAAWTDPGDGLVGTARYAAPEQGSAEALDGKADVYALGLVLVEAVTGSVPLTADTALGTLSRRVDTPVPVPAALGPLQRVLERAGRPDPAQRPDAGELVRAFLEAARELDPPRPLPLAGAVDLDDRPDSKSDPTLLPTSSPSGSAGVGPAEAGDVDAAGARADEQAPERRQGSTDASHVEEVRRRRRWPWVALAVLLVAVAAGGASYAWLELRPPRAAVPGVQGIPEAEARAELSRAQAAADDDLAWEIAVRREYNENVRADVVIRQDPPEGVELEDGGQVSLVVSRGPPPRQVPELAGLTEEEAVAALAEAELALGAVTTTAHEEVEAGRVVDWSERGELPKGSEVDVVVSTGPAPRQVPDLAGRSADEARGALEERGLAVEVVERFSRTVEAGVVIGTDPPAGATVERGSTVTLVVSKGRDLVTIPDVEGMSLSKAAEVLEQAGLTVGSVSGRAKGTVDDTDPDMGTRVDRGTTVNIKLE